MGENNGVATPRNAVAPPPLDAEGKLLNELRNVDELLEVVNAAPPEEEQKRPRAFGQGK
jgi:hypothetical protein